MKSEKWLFDWRNYKIKITKIDIIEYGVKFCSKDVFLFASLVAGNLFSFLIFDLDAIFKNANANQLQGVCVCVYVAKEVNLLWFQIQEMKRNWIGPNSTCTRVLGDHPFLFLISCLLFPI